MPAGRTPDQITEDRAVIRRALVWYRRAGALAFLILAIALAYGVGVADTVRHCAVIVREESRG